MTNENEPSAASLGGLASEMIPLLRQRLGLGPNEPSPPPEGILEFAAEMPAPEAPPSVVPFVQLITFGLGEQRYALPIEQVYEILRVTPITRVPHAPRAVRGLMNVRGRLLPVVEIRQLLDMPPVPVDKDSRIVTVQVRSRSLGLLVDRVGYVAKVPQNAIMPAPPEVVGRMADFVRAVATDAAGGLVVMLDLERVFDSDWRQK